MTKAEERAALEAMLAASSKTATKLNTQPMDSRLSASRVLAAPKKTAVERKVEKRTKRVKRNWDLQRRYDEMHGTVNGYDERLEETLAMHRREMGE